MSRKFYNLLKVWPFSRFESRPIFMECWNTGILELCSKSHNFRLAYKLAFNNLWSAGPDLNCPDVGMENQACRKWIELHNRISSRSLRRRLRAGGQGRLEPWTWDQSLWVRFDASCRIFDSAIANNSTLNERKKFNQALLVICYSLLECDGFSIL
jgi:hypothetical protein